MDMEMHKQRRDESKHNRKEGTEHLQVKANEGHNNNTLSILHQTFFCSIWKTVKL